MGYEIMLVVVDKGYASTEYVKSDIPYSDGSGFEDAKDEHGERIPTGRKGYYCSVIGTVDLCKVGGRTAQLDSYTAADEERNKTEFCYFFAPAGDGNTRVLKDRYDTPVRERNLLDVLKAMRADNKENPYRRFDAAIGLLDGIYQGFLKVGDVDRLRVLFYAH